jgi:signal transduction histidine kinase
MQSIARRSVLAFLPAVVLAAGIVAAPAHAKGANATKEEAVDMVKRGIAAIASMGADKAYAEFSTPNGKWVDRDLYLAVFRLDGTALAHGANPKQIGVNLMDRKDIDGKEFIRERMEMAKSKDSFWQDYKFINPVSKKIEQKTMYCEKAADTVVCGGVYK